MEGNSEAVVDGGLGPLITHSEEVFASSKEINPTLELEEEGEW